WFGTWGNDDYRNYYNLCVNVRRCYTHLHVRPRLVYGIAIWLAVLWLCVHVAGVVYNSLLGGVVLLVPVRN
ncbi:MAG: hypothetical protein AN485_20570, partial [Anabaena sp. MDT14b]